MDMGAALVLPMLRRCDSRGNFSILNVTEHTSKETDPPEVDPSSKILRTITECLEQNCTFVMTLSAPVDREFDISPEAQQAHSGIFDLIVECRATTRSSCPLPSWTTQRAGASRLHGRHCCAGGGARAPHRQDPGRSQRHPGILPRPLAAARRDAAPWHSSAPARSCTAGCAQRAQQPPRTEPRRAQTGETWPSSTRLARRDVRILTRPRMA